MQMKMPYVIDDQVGFLAPQSKQHFFFIQKKNFKSFEFFFAEWIEHIPHTLFDEIDLSLFKIVSTSVLDGSWEDISISL